MDHTQASAITELLITAFTPGCKRIEPAGSLRRQKADVGDIEIVAIPDLHPPRPVFGRKPFATTLDAILDSLTFPDEDGLVIHPLMGGPKYKKFWVSLDGGHSWLIKLDLFLVTPPADWGVEFLLRTGPEAFSKWMVTQRSKGGGLPDGYYVEGCAVWQAGTKEYMPMPEEIAFLNFCHLDWIDPQYRRPFWNTLPVKIQGHHMPQKAVGKEFTTPSETR